jgi:mannose-6-phosphate isomerase-like protein (cupin superfamily)
MLRLTAKAPKNAHDSGGVVAVRRYIGSGLTGGARQVEIVNRSQSAPFITRDGSDIRSILDRTNSRATNQSLAEATLPPGARTEPHLHSRTEEIYYILRGAGRMTVGREERQVGPGDGILIPPGTRHTIRNVGTDPLVFLCCCAPPYSDEDTVLELRVES